MSITGNVKNFFHKYHFCSSTSCTSQRCIPFMSRTRSPPGMLFKGTGYCQCLTLSILKDLYSWLHGFYSFVLVHVPPPMLFLTPPCLLAQKISILFGQILLPLISMVLGLCIQTSLKFTEPHLN